ncbi:MAG: MCE family protein [Gammaproteobacteria bacterium]|nr:MAG: MCE family protein [Gammaproteobacteria bacterium]
MIEETKSEQADMEPVQIEKSGNVLIWLLPVIAAMIAGWLLYKSVSETGEIVQIVFESAEGIEENKTKILYKGLAVGLVKKVTINADLESVLVEAEMKPEVEPYLRDGTHFWLVRPKVSLTEVTGLDTLVSGNYIAVSPGEGEPSTRFKALKNRPPMDESVSGLHIKLSADKLGSIEIGSRVYYREIPVGSVEGIELGGDAKSVLISVHIEEQYSYLVKKSTRFWNTSGIDFKASLAGIEVQTGSLASIIAGGVSFYNPPSKGDNRLSESGDQFALHKDYNQAEDGIMVKLHLPSGVSVIAGETTVRANGLIVGTVKRVEVDDVLHSTVTVKFHPHAHTLLKESTKFWLVDPSFSITRPSSIRALLQGGYIAVIGGKGAPHFEFDVSEKRPISDRSIVGLYLTLIADELGSLEKGSPVLYRKIKVGHIEDFQLDKKGEFVEIQLYIKEEYAHLVQKQSRFWNASGFDLRAGIEGFKLRTESVSTLLSGGVAFFNPETEKRANRAKNDGRFQLYEDKESAEHDSFPIDIMFAAARGLQVGAAIKFQGLKVGSVKSIELTGQGGEVVAQALMYGKSRSLIRQASKFWVVQPEIGLARTANLETLVTGRYVALKPGKGKVWNKFKSISTAPIENSQPGLKLTLVSPRLGSIKSGDPVYYRQIPVGRVIGTSLSPKTNAVFIQVNIEKRYAPLVRDNSRFWKASGLRMEASLFGGLQVETESVEALLSGGLAFATPASDQLGNRVSNNHTFELSQKMEPVWAKWIPEIALDQ